jgi:hypothetical protein
VKTGEIAVRNSTSETIIVLTHLDRNECSSPVLTDSRPWIAITTGSEKEFVVASWTWIGDACLSVSSLSRGASVEVSHGRLYEVTQGELHPVVHDIGPHDEPWYFDMQRWEWGWSSWWVWSYAIPILLGAPVGLFITVRFFYRFYVLKQG